MDYTIRPACLADANALFLLVQQFVTSFEPERSAFEVSLKALLADENAWLQVAEAQGALIGYCLGFDHYTFYANGRVAWVEEIMVKAEMRRHGVGESLMKAFEVWARSRESKLVALATRRATAFYTAIWL